MVVLRACRKILPNLRSWLLGGFVTCAAPFSAWADELPELPPVPNLTAAASAEETDAVKDGVGTTQLTAFQPPPTPPAPRTAPPTVLEPTEVIADEPTRPDFTPRMPAPENPFANSVYDSPFFAPPVQGYGAGSSTTATKLDIPIMDFPGIVNTVTQDLIQDRQSYTFEQALKTVPNVVPRTGAGFRSDEFYIRGFNVGFAGNDFRKDGFRDSSWTQRDVQNIERIEVLKGPASILYGTATQPAGIINVVTKKPLPGRFTDAYTTFGSYELFRTVGDINAPLLGNENVLTRVNYAVQDSGSFRDFIYVDRQFVAPAFTFVLDDQTTLTFQGEYLHDKRRVDRGLIFVPNNPTGNPLGLPLNRYLGQPTDDSEYNDGQFNLFLNRQINNNWFARMGMVANWSGEQRDNYDTRGLVGNNATRQYVLQRSIAQDYYYVGDLTGEVDGPLMKHRLLFGTELGTTVNDVFSRQSTVTGFPLNIFNPYTTPGANYSLYPAVPTLAAPLTSGSQQDQYGVYYQDLLEFTPYFKGLLGVRSSWYDLKSFNQGVKTEQSWQVWTPRYGLVFEPLPEDLSFYAAYSESFNPVTGFLQSGDALVPETGWGFDLGAKARLRDQLWVTVGYFDIERTNVAQAIPNSNPQRFQQFGLVRSTGMEAELFGNLTDRWSVQAGYGMADARIENDRVAANIGKHLTNSPYWQGSLWTRYNFIQNDDRTMGAGFGVFYTDFWAISTDNTFSVPGYTRFDMALYHDVRRWRTAVFIENLTDERYVSGANGNTTVLPGAPISVRGTIGVSF